MHGRWLLIALLTASPTALAQGEPEAAQPPAEPPAEKAAPPPERKAPRVDPAYDRQLAEEMARAFFAALVHGEANTVIDLSNVPFQLEDRKLSTREELSQAWSRSLRQKRTEGLTLYGVELFTPAEMEQKYGRPPARLANFPWRRPGVLVAVANISGRPAVAVFQRVAMEDWHAIGYHD